MLTIVVEKNPKTIWGPEGDWVAFTDSYDADQDEYREGYGNTVEDALEDLFDWFDDDQLVGVTIIVDGKFYHGYTARVK